MGRHPLFILGTNILFIGLFILCTSMNHESILIDLFKFRIGFVLVNWAGPAPNSFISNSILSDIIIPL